MLDLVVSIKNLIPKTFNCIICGKETAKGYGRQWILCEECKLIKNCFTCRYSKCWYFRYRGRCDINTEYLIIGDRKSALRIKDKIESECPDCRIYKMKDIGNTLRDFWEHQPCKRHQQGDATKEEYADYHADDWVAEDDMVNWSDDY